MAALRSIRPTWSYWMPCVMDRKLRPNASGGWRPIMFGEEAKGNATGGRVKCQAGWKSGCRENAHAQNQNVV
jgi:hypothetical protein